MRHRHLIVSSFIGLSVTLLNWWRLVAVQNNAGDFTWALRYAREMLAGRDPYLLPVSSAAIPYPLPAIFVAVPFAPLPNELGGALFFGLSTGLATYALLRLRGYVGLLPLLSHPFFEAFVTVQWSPAVMAAALIPVLLPLTMCKPQIGLPVVLTRPSKAGLIGCVAFGLLTLAYYPTWPVVWLGQLGQFQRFIPLLTVAGFPLLLALLRWRGRDARLLLLMALTPQRWFYDSLILWLIPRTRKEMVCTIVLSWFAGAWRVFSDSWPIPRVGLMAVLFYYLPMLVVVLARSKREGVVPTAHT